MSNAIDTAFAKAVSTLQTLSTWSTLRTVLKPPQADRVELYGLYKQATEGDISDQSVPFPTGDSPESDIARRKWRAWKGKEGMSNDDAKQRYTQYLLDVMKVYANGYDDADILESELEDALERAKEFALQMQKSARSEYINTDTFIRRAESPAVSLYRVASSGFNSKIARPPSRSYSITNINQIGKNDSTSFGVTLGLQEEPKNDDWKDERSSGPPNINRMDFIRWQNQVNYTLTKIAEKLDRMNNDQPSKATQYSSDTILRPLRKGNNTNIDNTDHEKWFIRTLYELRKATTDTLLKIYTYSRSCLTSTKSQTVIIILIYLIIHFLKSFRSHSVYQKLASTMMHLYSHLQRYFDRTHTRGLKTSQPSNTIPCDSS